MLFFSSHFCVSLQRIFNYKNCDLDMIINDYADEKMEIIQSYIMTVARYDFNVHEKRILTRIVEMTQAILQGKKLNQRYHINKDLFEMYDVQMPIAAVLTSDEVKHYDRIKNSLLKMTKKVFEYEDEEEWRAINLIIAPKIRKFDGLLKFKLHEDIYSALLNFTKGFKKFEILALFDFESVYAMRFYELFYNQRTPLTYSINELKLMFGIEKKYKNNADFLRYVIEAAKKELDEKSPYSFEYTPLKSGRKITAIRFYPIQHPQNVNEEFETERLKKQLTPGWTIERHILNYLKEHYMFSTPEIKNNIDLLENAQRKIPDLLMFLSEVKAKANRAGNPKGYLINALKKKLKIKAEKKAVAKDKDPMQMEFGF